MRWCFGYGAVNLGTTAQTQVTSGYFAGTMAVPFSAHPGIARHARQSKLRTLSGTAHDGLLWVFNREECFVLLHIMASIRLCFSRYRRRVIEGTSSRNC